MNYLRRIVSGVFVPGSSSGHLGRSVGIVDNVESLETLTMYECKIEACNLLRGDLWHPFALGSQL